MDFACERPGTPAPIVSSAFLAHSGCKAAGRGSIVIHCARAFPVRDAGSSTGTLACSSASLSSDREPRRHECLRHIPNGYGKVLPRCASSFWGPERPARISHTCLPARGTKSPAATATSTAPAAFSARRARFRVVQVNARNLWGIVRAARGSQLLVNASAAVFNEIVLRAALRIRCPLHGPERAPHAQSVQGRATSLRQALPEKESLPP